VFFSFFVSFLMHADPGLSLLWLRNAEVEAGIAPGLSGCVMVWRPAGGKNYLMDRQADWASWKSGVPDPLHPETWVDYFGHVIWLGPQSGFWNQQESVPQLRNQPWPPDPYWVYADYQVLEQSDDVLVLQGPVSPYSGLSFRKTYRLQGNSLMHEVEAVNGSGKTLKWGLWSNTRVASGIPVWVPAACDSGLRVESRFPGRVQWRLEDGFFRFDAEAFSNGQEEASAKAFLNPAKPCIVSFHDGGVFLKSFEPVAADLVAPGQAPVEIYHLKSRDGNPGFSELEFHGACSSLEPGQQMVLRETWTLIPGGSDWNEDACLEWLRGDRHRIGCGWGHRLRELKR
jgi:hypothetical protein